MQRILFVSATIMSLFTTQTSALYGGGSPVVKLTAANFDKLVTKGNELWFVEFYAPWCGHCKSLAPEWEKAARHLKGVIKVGAIDVDSEKQMGSRFGVQSFPTIKFFGFEKGKPQDY